MINQLHTVAVDGFEYVSLLELDAVYFVLYLPQSKVKDRIGVIRSRIMSLCIKTLTTHRALTKYFKNVGIISKNARSTSIITIENAQALLASFLIPVSNNLLCEDVFYFPLDFNNGIFEKDEILFKRQRRKQNKPSI